MNSDRTNSFPLQNNVAIVTGASQGVGAVILKGLSQSGAIVCGTGEPYVSEWQANKNESYIRCNARDGIAFQFLCEEIIEKYGKLSSLVNVTNIDLSILDTDSKKACLQTEIVSNLKKAISTSRVVAKLMKKSQGGSILNIIGIGNIIDRPNSLSYITAKNALLMMTKKLAEDLKLDNIRLNNIVFGYIQNSPQQLDRISSIPDLEANPENQWHDLIRTSVFLVSENSTAIAGQDIFIIGDREKRDRSYRVFTSIDDNP